MDFKDSHYICIYDPGKERRDFSYLSPRGMRKYAQDNDMPGLEARDAKWKKNLSDYLCIYDEGRGKWLWSLLTNKGMVKYAKEMKYDTGMRLFGLYQRKGSKLAPEFYHTVIDRLDGKEKLIDSIFPKKYNNWRGMTREQIEVFAKRTGMGPKDMSIRYPGLYERLRREGMLDTATKRKVRDWKGKSYREMVEYAKDHGLYKAGPKDATAKDPGFTRAVYRRGFDKRIFKARMFREFSGMSVDELKDFAVDNGFYGVNPRKVWLEDPGFYEHVRKRGLVDGFFVRKYPGKEVI